MATLHFAFVTAKLPSLISSLRDTADRPLLYASQRYDRRFSASSIRSDGNRRGRPVREDGEAEIPESVDDTSPPKSKKQDEIIAVFRRIQKSILNGEAVVAPKKKRSSKLSRDKSSAESVLEVLRLSSKKVKGKNTKEEVIETSSTRRGGHKKEEQEVDDEEEQVKPTRPLSKFVRRSPISQPVGAKLNYVRQNTEALPLSIAGGKEGAAMKVDDMKVTELKEVAKSRGIKGYSKLKKSELQALLRP